LPGSSGSLQGSVVNWSLSSLAPYQGAIQTSFAVSTSQTIINYDFRVTADGGFLAAGANPVITIIVTDVVYLPVVLRE